jgi:hypothetical protein
VKIVQPVSRAAAPRAPSSANTAKEAIEYYVRAKDQNLPWLMESAFAANATLDVIVNAGTLAFPPVSHGLPAIADVLVRRFAQTYENVHTFCLTDPPRGDQLDFSCDWLVGMSEKESRAVRVGCGRYDWRFPAEGPRLAERLTITVQAMESLPSASLKAVMRWFARLPNPWCPAADALAEAPALDELRSVRHYLARDSA